MGRIPQLKLMLNTINVSGINPAFFCLTFSGNLTQCLSMLINKQIYQNRPDFLSKLPWLVSSGICIFQDGVIIFLIYLYRANSTELIHDYSKVVMLPSPHSLSANIENIKKKKKKRKKKNKLNVDVMDDIMERKANYDP